MPDVEDQTQVEVDETDETTDETTTDETDESSSPGDETTDETPPGEGDETVEHKGKAAQEFVEGILNEYGLESPDELKTFMANLSELSGKVGDQDLDEIIKNSNTLKEYQVHWAKAEREKQKEGETPEETIKRLEGELESAHDEKKQIISQRKEAQAAQVAITAFNNTVTSVIEADDNVPSEYRNFLSEFMGVENPINDIDIDDKAKVRKLTKAGIKKLQAFEQVVIKRYRDGKIKVPKVSKTQTSTVVDESKKNEPKNLREAKKIFTQGIQAILGKKQQ